MTVGENLAFPLKNRGLPRDRIDARVTEIAKLLDLTPYLDRKATRLSADAKQRNLAGPRPCAVRCRCGAVRRAADGDRSASEMGTALEAQGAASGAGSHDDLRHPRPDRGADLRRYGRGDARRQRGAERHAGRPVCEACAYLRRLFHRLSRHEYRPGERERPRRADRWSYHRTEQQLTTACRPARKSKSVWRPEFVHVAPPAPGLLSAQIERIDDLGRVRFARVRIGDAKFAARVPNDFSIPDKTAGLVFDPAHVHVYADSLLVEGRV